MRGVAQISCVQARTLNVTNFLETAKSKKAHAKTQRRKDSQRKSWLQSSMKRTNDLKIFAKKNFFVSFVSLWLSFWLRLCCAAAFVVKKSSRPLYVFESNIFESNIIKIFTSVRIPFRALIFCFFCRHFIVFIRTRYYSLWTQFKKNIFWANVFHVTPVIQADLLKNIYILRSL